jgi:hypothetical protein
MWELTRDPQYPTHLIGFAEIASQLDDHQRAAGYIEGTVNRPQVFPTSRQCETARKAAVEHASRQNVADADLLAKINSSKEAYLKNGDYAGRPLAHNQSGALVFSFVELWRALDSSLYRESPQGASSAPLVRALIPFVVARHQRYFVIDCTSNGHLHELVSGVGA